MSETLNDQIVTIVVTALISGLVIPPLAKLLDKMIERKSDIKKQLRERQVELLDNLTRVIWKWRFLAKEIPYHGFYKNTSAHAKTKYPDAVKNYREAIWDMLLEMKSIKSGVMVWFSEAEADEVEKLYTEVKLIDSDLESTIIEDEMGGDCTPKFQKLSKEFSDVVSANIDNHLKVIAAKIKRGA